MHSISDRLRAYGKVESCISACGILVLAALYVYWWTSTPRSLAGRAAALVSLVLFIWVCLRFVPVWVAAWRGNELPATPKAAKAAPEEGRSILDQPLRLPGAAGPVRHIHITPTGLEGGAP